VIQQLREVLPPEAGRLKKNLQRVRRESPQVLPLYRKSLKQASHQFHICIKFQWQVWTQ
jgi:hypothetical protein